MIDHSDNDARIVLKPKKSAKKLPLTWIESLTSRLLFEILRL